MSKIINYQGSMDALVWHKKEKKLSCDSMVIVPVSHEAIFVKNKKMADSFTLGSYKLSEDAVGANKLFSDPSERVDCIVYYVKKEGSYNIKWHTSPALKYIDPVLKISVEAEISGVFAIKIIDAKQFLSRLLGVMNEVRLEDVKVFFREKMLESIQKRLLEVMTENSISTVELNKKSIQVAKLLEINMRYMFDDFGVVVEGVILKKADLIGAGEIDSGEPLICAVCKERLVNDAMFCHKCGAKVS